MTEEKASYDTGDFQRLLKKSPKSKAETMLCQAIAALSTHPQFMEMTPWEVYEKLAKDSQHWDYEDEVQKTWRKLPPSEQALRILKMWEIIRGLTQRLNGAEATLAAVGEHRHGPTGKVTVPLGEMHSYKGCSPVISEEMKFLELPDANYYHAFSRMYRGLDNEVYLVNFGSDAGWTLSEVLRDIVTRDRALEKGELILRWSSE